MLGIVATISKDGRIRIWDTECYLVRELSFDEEVEGICFANERGDLLIGLQSNIYSVPAWNYLTVFYLGKLLDTDIKDDEVEICTAFDPLLNFWHDSSTIPLIPIGKTNRQKLCRSGRKSLGLMPNDVSILHFLFPSFVSQNPWNLFTEGYSL